MRVLSAVALALTASCGTDVRTGTSDPVDTLPDAGSPMNTPMHDAALPPTDGEPPNLAPCEAAIYHQDFTFIQERIFTPSCATSMCHTGSDPDAGQNLTAGAAYASLINVNSTQFSGWKRVVPGDPAHSMLMVQLGGEPGPELEGTMPWGEPKLCDPLIDSVRRWIAAGAAEQ
jgi:hypothetical protein